MVELLRAAAPGWDDRIARLPGAHVLQTWEWAQMKARLGWQALPLEWKADDGQVCAAALVLQRSLRLAGIRLPVQVLYVPKGPLLDWGNAPLRDRVLADLQGFARQQGAIFIKVDPDVTVGTGIPGSVDDCEDPVGAQVCCRAEPARLAFLLRADPVPQYRAAGPAG